MTVAEMTTVVAMATTTVAIASAVTSADNEYVELFPHPLAR
jgi:hypothetical protein